MQAAALVAPGACTHGQPFAPAVCSQTWQLTVYDEGGAEGSSIAVND